MELSSNVFLVKNLHNICKEQNLSWTSPNQAIAIEWTKGIVIIVIMCRKSNLFNGPKIININNKNKIKAL